jgi:hypothetical protein
MKERIPGCICELNEQTGEPIVEKYEMCPVHKSEAPNPKNTAEELVEKFYMIVDCDLHAHEGRICSHQAQTCALFHVDEILTMLESFQRHEYVKILIPFYHEVRNEIEAL